MRKEKNNSSTTLTKKSQHVSTDICFWQQSHKKIHGGKMYVLRCDSFVWSAKCYCQKLSHKNSFRSEAVSKLLQKYFPRHSSCRLCCREPTRRRDLERGPARGVEGLALAARGDEHVQAVVKAEVQNQYGSVTKSMKMERKRWVPVTSQPAIPLSPGAILACGQTFEHPNVTQLQE